MHQTSTPHTTLWFNSALQRENSLNELPPAGFLTWCYTCYSSFQWLQWYIFSDTVQLKLKKCNLSKTSWILFCISSLNTNIFCSTEHVSLDQIAQYKNTDNLIVGSMLEIIFIFYLSNDELLNLVIFKLNLENSVFRNGKKSTRHTATNKHRAKSNHHVKNHNKALPVLLKISTQGVIMPVGFEYKHIIMSYRHDVPHCHEWIQLVINGSMFLPNAKFMDSNEYILFSCCFLFL